MPRGWGTGSANTACIRLFNTASPPAGRFGGMLISQVRFHVLYVDFTVDSTRKCNGTRAFVTYPGQVNKEPAGKINKTPPPSSSNVEFIAIDCCIVRRRTREMSFAH